MGSAIDSMGSFVLVIAIVVGLIFVVRKFMTSRSDKIEK